MAVNAEAICNSALIKIGAATITSLSESSVEAEACNEQFTKLRDDLLRSHPWNFAMKRAFLGTDNFTFVDADVSVANNTITEIAHGRTNGDRLRLTTLGVLPEGLEPTVDYFVSQADANTFKLALTAAQAIAAVEDIVEITAAAGGGTHTVTFKPTFEFDFLFLLPTDYMRAFRLEPKKQRFIIEEDKLYTTNEEAFLIYISQITDTTKFEKNFDELLAIMIAHELAYPLVHSITLKESTGRELLLKLRDVRSFDAQEGTPEEFEANTFIDARL